MTTSTAPSTSPTRDRRSGWSFSVQDLARFLGKSPVTLRKWEAQGLMTFPRLGNERRATTDDVRRLSRLAFELGRISKLRLQMIEAAVTMLEWIESANH